jgi:hypothetical protein
MKPWHAVVGLTLIVLSIASWRIASYERERNQPGVATQKPAARPLTDDELVMPRRLFIDSLKSAKELNGKTVWMKTGYTLPYYAYRTGRVDFAHEAGRLPPAQELAVKDFTVTSTPPGWVSSVPRGAKNAFVLFTEPGRSGEFAAPVATLDGGNGSWACDDIFFYQDPKTLYHWPAEIWQAVSQHTAKQGMSEIQTSMALGNLQQSQSKDFGNRTVSYTTIDGGQTHRYSVTFSRDKATSVSSQ